MAKALKLCRDLAQASGIRGVGDRVPAVARIQADRECAQDPRVGPILLFEHALHTLRGEHLTTLVDVAELGQLLRDLA
jgi:hypothetical protein